jgi:hypothetical protein
MQIFVHALEDGLDGLLAALHVEPGVIGSIGRTSCELPPSDNARTVQ